MTDEELHAAAHRLLGWYPPAKAPAIECATDAPCRAAIALARAAVTAERERAAAGPMKPVDFGKFAELVLDYDNHPWRREAEIIPAYMPPFPQPSTRPRCVVRWRHSFLRHSRGPLQHHSWDIYGDDYLTPELALLALSQAPPHPRLMALGVSESAKDADGWARIRSGERPTTEQPAGKRQGTP